MPTYYLTEDRGQALFEVAAPGYGVIEASWSDAGVPGHVVAVDGLGVQTVYFENGHPPGSILGYAKAVAAAQARAVAYARLLAHQQARRRNFLLLMQ